MNKFKMNQTLALLTDAPSNVDGIHALMDRVDETDKSISLGEAAT
jgi:hypothetical protein